MTRPAQTEAHIQFARKRTHHSSWHAEQTHLLVLLMEEQAILLLGEFLGSAARTNDYAKTTSLLERQGSGIETSVAQGLRGRGQSQWQHPRHMFPVALFHPSQFVEVRNLAGNLDGNFPRIETRDPPRPCRTPSEKAAFPAPLGLTTPMPVIITRRFKPSPLWIARSKISQLPVKAPK